MEVGVRIIGIFLRLIKLLLDILSAPLEWFSSRKRQVCPPDHNPILTCSVTDLAERIRSGELTSEEVVSTYIERVKFVNRYLNAVVDERYQPALEEAKRVDKLLAEARRTNDWSGLEEKPLLGVPFTVKSSCSLAGLSNAVGCLEWAGRRATADGAAVRRLRSAGAVPLLVSNTPELSLGWETTNLLHGATSNPYDLARTPGGSSGGEGALIASGASPFGIASDIAGSIRIPAAFCGVFGLKPTPGIIEIEGHIPTLTDPQFSRFLCVGPLARRAADLTLLYKALAGCRADKLRLDEKIDFTSLKIFYMTEAAKSIALIDTHPRIKEVIIKAVKYLEKECGCTVSEKKFKKFEDSVEMSISVFFSMKDMPNLLADPANPKREKSMLVEVMKHILGCATRSLQGLGFALIERHRLFIPAARTRHYTQLADQLREELVETLSSDGVLLYPVFTDVAHRRGGVFVRAGGVLYTMPANILGLPAVVVPLGLCHGLPLALQIIAAPNQDRLCLAVAKKLEEAFGGWQPVPSPV